MFKKFLMAAGLAAAFSLSAQVAEAKVKVTIGIGSLADIATIITILSAAAAMAIIPGPGTLSPIRIMTIGTACPAVRPAGLSGSAAFAMCARQIAAASITLSLPGKRAEFSGLKFTQEMAGSIPSGQFDARM